MRTPPIFCPGAIQQYGGKRRGLSRCPHIASGYAVAETARKSCPHTSDRSQCHCPESQLIVAGLTLGIIVALVATPAIGSFLWGVSANDPLTFALATGGLAAVALLACYLPALRALRVEPALALHNARHILRTKIHDQHKASLGGYCQQRAKVCGSPAWIEPGFTAHV